MGGWSRSAWSSPAPRRSCGFRAATRRPASRLQPYRLEVWREFLLLIGDGRLGYGSFSPAGITLHTGKFLDQAHNLVLSAWFRGGLASAPAMVLILVGGIYWSWRHHAATGDAAPLAMMTTIAIAGMFDYQLLVTYPNWPWVTFWLPFGLAAGAEMASRNAARLNAAEPIARLRPVAATSRRLCRRGSSNWKEPAMSEDKRMRLVVVGAAGRMGQTLIRTIHTSEGVTVAGAIERAGSPPPIWARTPACSPGSARSALP